MHSKTFYKFRQSPTGQGKTNSNNDAVYRGFGELSSLNTLVFGSKFIPFDNGGSNFGLLEFGNSIIVPFSVSYDNNYTQNKFDYGLISYSSYAGVHVADRNATGLLDLNSVYTDHHFSSQSVTLLSTFTLTGDVDNLAGTVGVHIGGFELHLGPTLLGGMTLGASYSDELGQSGGDATMSVGGLLLAPIRWIIYK